MQNREVQKPAEAAEPVSLLTNWFSGAVLETLPAAVYVCDADATIVAYNQRAAELWGRAPRAGDSDEKYCGSHKLFLRDGAALPHNKTPMALVLETGKPARDMEVVLERPDASRLPVLVNIAPLFRVDGTLIGAVNCFQDLSTHERVEREKLRLAEELHQAKKMEAIGRLTAGIVHDFNNLLTAILGNLDMLKSRTTESGSLKLLVNVVQAAERGERLTRQLLAFAHKQQILPQAVDLNQVFDDMNDLLQTSIGSTIVIATRKAPGLRPALVDPSQIEFVLLNLAINARDAMPSGGTLTIETANVTLGGSDDPAELPAGDYVVVSVRDTGTGMSDEVRAKAFEPFFTTKASGKGSGLGLSMALVVARQSGGDVRITSHEGEGTSIEVYLPCVDTSASFADRAADGSTQLC